MNKLHEYTEAFTVGLASVISEIDKEAKLYELYELTVPELITESLLLLKQLDYRTSVKSLYRIYTMSYEVRLKELLHSGADTAEITELLKEVARLKDKIRD